MNKKISTLPSADAIDGSELVPIVQSGTTKQTTISELRPYKVYSALLTQSGTDAPNAIVLENTIGNIVWTRDQNGGYFATLTNAFPQEKTFISITPNSQGIDIPFFTANWNTVDNIGFFTLDGNTVTYTDGLLINTPIEIRVYN